MIITSVQRNLANGRIAVLSLMSFQAAQLTVEGSGPHLIHGSAGLTGVGPKHPLVRLSSF